MYLHVFVNADMEFVQKFTLPDFQAKNFTPSISPNFNSFSKKKHKKWVKVEKFTPLKNFTLPPAVTALTNSTSAGWYLTCRERIKPRGSNSTCIKNPMRLSSLIWKTHKTAEPSWADTFRVCKSTAFLAVLNKGILVESWKIWFSDQLKEETDPWRTLKTDPTRIKLKLAGWTRSPVFLSTSEKWKST